MLEPRRLATRAAAARMASLLGEPVGRTVGFRTRLDSAVSAETRIEVVTEGLLVRRLQSDPGLDGVAAVILDEIHERSLESDLALALCLDLQAVLRPELRLLAMSATADGARLSALMRAEVVESAGRMFPVTVQHAARDIAGPRDLPDAMARAVRAALAEHAGDILAFLPGMAEIRRAEAALQGCGALVLPLHGELPPDAQDRALRPAETRRVVLATSIAETSLTVPGVRIVVDGGWRRAPRLDPGTGLTRLDHAAHLPRRRRATRRPGGPRRPRRGDPPVVDGAASRPASLRPAGNPGGRAVVAGAGLRRLGHAAAPTCRSPTSRRPARWPPPARCWWSLARWTPTGASPTRAAAWRCLARIRAWPPCCSPPKRRRRRRWPPISPPCWRNATRCARPTPRPISACACRRSPMGDAAADRGALSRIRRAAAQYRRRLRLPAEAQATTHSNHRPPTGDPAGAIAAR